MLSATSNTSNPFYSNYFIYSLEWGVLQVNLDCGLYEKSWITEAQHEQKSLCNNTDAVWDLPKNVWKFPRLVSGGLNVSA